MSKITKMMMVWAAVAGMALCGALSGCDRISSLLGPGKDDLEKSVKEELPGMISQNLGEIATVQKVCSVDLIKKSDHEYTGMTTVELRSKSEGNVESVRYSLNVTVDGDQYFIEAEPMDKDKLLKLGLGRLSSLFD